MTEPLPNAQQAKFISNRRVRKGLTQEMLADKLGVDVGTVARWERGAQKIRSRNEVALAAALDVELEHLRDPSKPEVSEVGSDASSRDLRTLEFIAWIANQFDAPFDEVYKTVAQLADELESRPRPQRYADSYAQTKISRDDIAVAIASYYDLPTDSQGLYSARIGGRRVTLSILAERSWINRNIDLGAGGERARLQADSSIADLPVNDALMKGAVHKLADVETTSKVLVNNPMYRLKSFEISDDALTTEFELVDFADYALRNGLMEQEFTDWLAATKRPAVTGATDTPLRDLLLPDLESVANLGDRCCTGGPVALLAVARPGDEHRPADFALFVQTRSNQVLDIPGRLSTIPKGWHQPVGEPSMQTPLKSTLLRELEEELFGREDLEQLAVGSRRSAVPLHSHHRIEALRSIVDNADTFKVRCAGFGMNLVSGTFEAPCLIVIDHDEWWTEWGHLIVGNWETESVNLYSSMDRQALTSLAHDQRWTNEGLFALIEGLLLLEKLDTKDRVQLPSIEIL